MKEIISWILYMEQNKELVACGGKDSGGKGNRRIYLPLNLKSRNEFSGFIANILNKIERQEDTEYKIVSSDEKTNKCKKYVQYENVKYVLDMTIMKKDF